MYRYNIQLLRQGGVVVFQLGLFFHPLQMTCRKNRPTCHWLQANNQTLERSLGWLLFHFYSFLFLLSFYNWYFEIESTRYSYISHFLNHWRIIEWSLIIHDPPGYYWLIIGHHGWIINTKWRRSWFHAVCMIGFKPNQLQITVGEAKATTFSQKHGTVHRNFHGCIKRHCPFWDACAFNKTQISTQLPSEFWIFLLDFHSEMLSLTPFFHVFGPRLPWDFSRNPTPWNLEMWLEHLPKNSPIPWSLQRNSLVAQVPLRKKSLIELHCHDGSITIFFNHFFLN